MQEFWKPIKGYEGLYEISTQGKVKSLNYRGLGVEGTLSEASLSAGYKYVVLSKNGVTSNKLIHRLVAEAFLPNLQSLPEINHIDENKGNNHRSNLEWCTHKYNSNYGTRLSRFKETRRNNAKGFKAVKCSNGKTYSSTKEAARELGLFASNIRNQLIGKYKQVKGLTFEYVNEEDYLNGIV